MIGLRRHAAAALAALAALGYVVVAPRQVPLNREGARVLTRIDASRRMLAYGLSGGSCPNGSPNRWWPLGVTGVVCYDSFNRTGYPRTSTNPRGYHWAQDFSTRRRSDGRYVNIAGAPVKPVRPGVVQQNGWNAGGWGWYVRIAHDDGDSWIYAHLRAQSPLKPGTRITTRVTLGYVGCTGNCSGPHLHLEHWKGTDSGRDPRYNPAIHYRPAYRQVA